MPLTGGISICTHYCTDEMMMCGCKRDVVHKSHKVPAYHQICIEIDLHSHSACTRLTEIFPPARQDYIENAIIMYLTTL